MTAREAMDDLTKTTMVQTAEGGDIRVGTGRLYRADTRDRAYEMTEARLRSVPMIDRKRRIRPWRVGDSLNQGATNRCTIFTSAHFLQADPYLHTLAWPDSLFTMLYHEAQEVDDIPGENYEGTTMRGVCKVLQQRSLISEYLWVTKPEIAQEYLATRGTLAFGSDWMECMNTPDKNGYVEVDGVPGMMGHEYLLRWYYGKRHSKYPDTYEFQNSWGERWGDGGMFRMKADAFEYLFLQLNGDLVSMIETARKA